jgi:hypothetical protein
MPAGGGTVQRTADEITEVVPKAAEAGCLAITTHGSPPARSAALTQDAGAAAAAAADRRLELFGNQMGRIALAVSAEVEHLHSTAMVVMMMAADSFTVDSDDYVEICMFLANPILVAYGPFYSCGRAMGY